MSRLRFRERDDVANRTRPGHQHRPAIDTEGNTAVRWRAVAQRTQQEVELALSFLFADAEHLEHCTLHILAMDTHRTATELGSVQHQIVSLGQRFPRRIDERLGSGFVGAVNGW